MTFQFPKNSTVNVEEMSRLKGAIAECDQRLAQFRPEEQRLLDMEKDITHRIRANRQGLVRTAHLRPPRVIGKLVD